MRRTRSIEIPVTWNKLCAVGMKVQDSAYDGVAALLSHTRRKTRSSNKGRRPKQTTTREPDWRNLARYDERKVDLDEIVHGA